MKTCYIFAAAEGEPESFTPSKEDLVIAADAGYLKLKKIGYMPHIAVGDFDSLGEIANCPEIIKHPVMKDDTDTLLAVKTGLERGYKRFVLYGCAGKRLDHTLANLQTLNFIASKGGTGFLCGKDFTATALTNNTIQFSEKAKGNISVFSQTDQCAVSINGLLYPLKNKTVTFDFPLGVSNEFTGSASEITVTNGTALIIWSGDLNYVV